MEEVFFTLVSGPGLLPQLEIVGCRFNSLNNLSFLLCRSRRGELVLSLGRARVVNKKCRYRKNCTTRNQKNFGEQKNREENESVSVEGVCIVA